MHRQTHPIRRLTDAAPGAATRARAFTLLELLTVIVIIGLLSAVIVPTISALTRGGRVEAGMNTLSAAVSVARALIWRDTAMIEDLPTGAGVWAQSPNGYSGVALLVTAREIRFVENYAGAVDGSNQPRALELINGVADPWDRPRYLNPFRDIEGVDDIRLPAGVGLAGISRGGSDNGEFQFLAPPFAIRFDPDGRIVHGKTTQDRWVFYNGNGDTRLVAGNPTPYDRIPITSSRSGAGNLDPDEWDPSSPEYASLPLAQRRDKWLRDPVSNELTRRLRLPFEGIDTVLGVVIYDKNKFQQLFDGQVQEGWPSFEVSAANVNPFADRQPSYEATVAAFLLREGRMVFFNRYTGTLVTQ